MPLFITAIAAGEPVTIFGDGEQSRDFTYVGNVVDAPIARGRRRRATGRISTSRPARPERERARRRDRPRSRQERREALCAERPGDIRDSWADISEAKRLIGFEPHVGLEEGLGRTIEHLLG